MFGGRKTKKELRELKEEHHDLEEKFDNLREEHDKLQKETGEETNVRISYIEEEIESMNQRVEKLANDSYEIRGEVRDIHESVVSMQTSLSEIVKLYKAIITQYGFGDVQEKRAKAPPRAAGRRPGEEPGDAIIRALEEDKGKGPSKAPPRPAGGGMAASPPPKPRPAPMSSNALDELHRLSGETRDEEGLAEKVVARSDHGDKVGRVAKRDMERPSSSDMDREGEFTRSLPKKDLRPRGATSTGGAIEGPGWETMEAPPTEEGRRKRSKPKLEDLLSPE